MAWTFLNFQARYAPIHYYGQVLQIGESLGSSCDDHYDIAADDPLSVCTHIGKMAGKFKLVWEELTMNI